MKSIIHEYNLRWNTVDDNEHSKEALNFIGIFKEFLFINIPPLQISEWWDHDEKKHLCCRINLYSYNLINNSSSRISNDYIIHFTSLSRDFYKASKLRILQIPPYILSTDTSQLAFRICIDIIHEPTKLVIASGSQLISPGMTSGSNIDAIEDNQDINFLIYNMMENIDIKMGYCKLISLSKSNLSIPIPDFHISLGFLRTQQSHDVHHWVMDVEYKMWSNYYYSIYDSLLIDELKNPSNLNTSIEKEEIPLVTPSPYQYTFLHDDTSVNNSLYNSFDHVISIHSADQLFCKQVYLTIKNLHLTPDFIEHYNRDNLMILVEVKDYNNMEKLFIGRITQTLDTFVDSLQLYGSQTAPENSSDHCASSESVKSHDRNIISIDVSLFYLNLEHVNEKKEDWSIYDIVSLISTRDNIRGSFVYLGSSDCSSDHLILNLDFYNQVDKRINYITSGIYKNTMIVSFKNLDYIIGEIELTVDIREYDHTSIIPSSYLKHENDVFRNHQLILEEVFDFFTSKISLHEIKEKTLPLFKLLNGNENTYMLTNDFNVNELDIASILREIFPTFTIFEIISLLSLWYCRILACQFQINESTLSKQDIELLKVWGLFGYSDIDKFDRKEIFNCLEVLILQLIEGHHMGYLAYEIESNKILLKRLRKVHSDYLLWLYVKDWFTKSSFYLQSLELLDDVFQHLSIPFQSPISILRNDEKQSHSVNNNPLHVSDEEMMSLQCVVWSLVQLSLLQEDVDLDQMTYRYNDRDVHALMHDLFIVCLFTPLDLIVNVMEYIHIIQVRLIHFDITNNTLFSSMELIELISQRYYAMFFELTSFESIDDHVMEYYIQAMINYFHSLQIQDDDVDVLYFTLSKYVLSYCKEHYHQCIESFPFELFCQWIEKLYYRVEDKLTNWRVNHFMLMFDYMLSMTFTCPDFAIHLTSCHETFESLFYKLEHLLKSYLFSENYESFSLIELIDMLKSHILFPIHEIASNEDNEDDNFLHLLEVLLLVNSCCHVLTMKYHLLVHTQEFEMDTTKEIKILLACCYLLFDVILKEEKYTHHLYCFQSKYILRYYETSLQQLTSPIDHDDAMNVNCDLQIGMMKYINQYQFKIDIYYHYLDASTPHVHNHSNSNAMMNEDNDDVFASICPMIEIWIQLRLSLLCTIVAFIDWSSSSSNQSQHQLIQMYKPLLNSIMNIIDCRPFRRINVNVNEDKSNDHPIVMLCYPNQQSIASLIRLTYNIMTMLTNELVELKNELLEQLIQFIQFISNEKEVNEEEEEEVAKQWSEHTQVYYYNQLIDMIMHEIFNIFSSSSQSMMNDVHVIDNTGNDAFKSCCEVMRYKTFLPIAWNDIVKEENIQYVISFFNSRTYMSLESNQQQGNEQEFNEVEEEEKRYSQVLSNGNDSIYRLFHMLMFHRIYSMKVFSISYTLLRHYQTSCNILAIPLFQVLLVSTISSYFRNNNDENDHEAIQVLLGMVDSSFHTTPSLDSNDHMTFGLLNSLSFQLTSYLLLLDAYDNKYANEQQNITISINEEEILKYLNLYRKSIPLAISLGYWETALHYISKYRQSLLQYSMNLSKPMRLAITNEIISQESYIQQVTLFSHISGVSSLKEPTNEELTLESTISLRCYPIYFAIHIINGLENIQEYKQIFNEHGLRFYLDSICDLMPPKDHHNEGIWLIWRFEPHNIQLFRNNLDNEEDEVKDIEDQELYIQGSLAFIEHQLLQSLPNAIILPNHTIFNMSTHMETSSLMIQIFPIYPNFLSKHIYSHHWEEHMNCETFYFYAKLKDTLEEDITISSHSKIRKLFLSRQYSIDINKDEIKTKFSYFLTNTCLANIFPDDIETPLLNVMIDSIDLQLNKMKFIVFVLSHLSKLSKKEYLNGIETNQHNILNYHIVFMNLLVQLYNLLSETFGIADFYSMIAGEKDWIDNTFQDKRKLLKRKQLQMTHETNENKDTLNIQENSTIYPYVISFQPLGISDELKEIEEEYSYEKNKISNIEKRADNLIKAIKVSIELINQFLYQLETPGSEREAQKAMLQKKLHDYRLMQIYIEAKFAFMDKSFSPL